MSAGPSRASRTGLVISHVLRSTALAAHAGNRGENHERVRDARDDEHRQRRIRRLEHDEEADERDPVDAVDDRLAERVAREDDQGSAERDEREHDGLERRERRDDHASKSGSSTRWAARAVAITSAGFRRKRSATAAIASIPPEVRCSRTSAAARIRKAGTVVLAAA